MPGWCEPRVRMPSPCLLQRMDHGAHRLAAEAHARGDPADALAVGARQHDLRAPEDKGIGRAQAVLQGASVT